MSYLGQHFYSFKNASKSILSEMLSGDDDGYGGYSMHFILSKCWQSILSESLLGDGDGYDGYIKHFIQIQMLANLFFQKCYWVTVTDTV
jgi:hypothetical protein